ncbi:hypothetical protein, partial [uncultured Fibrobacter sp.]|uniref:hypothetical protein n=1 Tax=uncultured Fibrobacter sp. TaxID=261512 RepID=UPI002624FF8D
MANFFAKKKELPQTGDPIKSRLRLLHPYGVRNDNAFSVASEKKRTPANGSSYKIPDGDCFTPTGFAMTTPFQLRARPGTKPEAVQIVRR